MNDKTDALVLVRRSQLIELQAEVSDDASLAHERIRSILAAQPAGAVGERWRIAAERILGKTSRLYHMICQEAAIVKVGAEMESTPPAASVDVEAVAVPRNPSQDWLDKVANLLGIDSAEMDNIHAAILSATPQPAEGDGAVAEVIDALGTGVLIPQWIGTAPAPVLPIGTRLYTRPSAAAAVPEGWEIVVEGDAVRVTRPGGVVSEWTSRPNTNGSGMYDLCRALAQQEPRHD